MNTLLHFILLSYFAPPQPPRSPSLRFILVNLDYKPCTKLHLQKDIFQKDILYNSPPENGHETILCGWLSTK